MKRPRIETPSVRDVARNLTVAGAAGAVLVTAACGTNGNNTQPKPTTIISEATISPVSLTAQRMSDFNNTTRGMANTLLQKATDTTLANVSPAKVSNTEYLQAHGLSDQATSLTVSYQAGEITFVASKPDGVSGQAEATSVNFNWMASTGTKKALEAKLAQGTALTIKDFTTPLKTGDVLSPFDLAIQSGSTSQTMSQLTNPNADPSYELNGVEINDGNANAIVNPLDQFITSEITPQMYASVQ